MAGELLLINPKRRSGARKPRSAAQKAATRKLVALNRSKRRSNPIATNPKRRARRSVARTTTTIRRRRHRNPISLKSPMALLMPALMGAGGALAVNAAINYLPLPAFAKAGRTRYLTQFGLAFALGVFGKKFIGAKAEEMAKGAMIVTMTNALKDVVGGATGLQLGDAGDDGAISYYSPAQIAEYVDGNSGIDMYVSGVPEQSYYGMG